MQRVRARDGGSDRHRVHLDSERLDDLVRELSDGTFGPLDLDLDTIRVDTTNGYAPSLDELVARIRTAIG